MKTTLWKMWVLMAAMFFAGGCVSLTPQEDEQLGKTVPTVLVAKSDGGGRLTVLWRAPQEPAGLVEYQLYRQKAGEPFKLWKQFDAPDVGSEVQTTSMIGAASGEVYYFRATSVLASGHGLETRPSDVLGVRVQDSGNEILVVQDRGDSGKFDASGEVVALYGDSLNQLGESFDSCLSEALLSGDIALEGYQRVLWTCGEDWKEPVTTEERALIKSYLDREGDLFICGSGIGLALADNDAQPDSQEFYQGYLKACYEQAWKRLPAQVQLEGAPDAPLWQKEKARVDSRGARRSCRLEPYGGSDPVLYYAGVRGASAAAVAYVGNYATPNAFSRMVYLGVPWESLSTAQQRTSVLKEILNYLAKAGPLKRIGVVQGILTDAKTGAPVDAARVSLLGGTNYLGVPIETRSRAEGDFSLVALQGTYHLAVDASGYRRVVLRNVRVRRDRPPRVEIALEPTSKQ